MRARGLITLAVALTLGAGARDAFDDWVDATPLPPLLVETSVEVTDHEGVLLRAYTVADGRWRFGVQRHEVDPGFTAMLVAYEDKRFWRHAGVDPLAMLRAGAQALRYGEVVSGGSTLTMQVARLLEDGPTGRWQGKLRQARLALALERRLSKEQILALYLNRAPYGGNLEGIRAATRAWFGKEPGRLTPAEAALLVALPQSPETRRPDRSHRAAGDARDRVLARMVRAGVLTQAEAEAAMLDPVPVARRELPQLAPHLADRLRTQDPARQVHATTLDADLQERLEVLAERAVRDHGQGLSIAIIAADHRTGEVLASVGSAGYRADGRRGFVDMTRALRSPGSTLKPLVYALAFDEGLAHPDTLIEDRPVQFGAYAPENFDGQFRGTVKVSDALKLSLNIPVIHLTEAIGPARLIQAMERAGAPAHLPGEAAPGLAVALGGVGVRPEEMLELYATLANQGRRVHLEHRADASAPHAPEQVITPEAAWAVAHILADMTPPPNAPRNRLAYKTGTSYGHRDTWAIGFDGAHVALVWMGRADGTPVPGAFGADLAAPVLFEVFSRLSDELEPLPPPPPGTLMAGQGELPEPLREFRPRDGYARPDPRAVKLAFPPDGALVEIAGGALVAKLRDGKPPFTWFANGAPVLIGARDREAVLTLPGPGFVQISVVDAEGRSARAEVELR